MASGNIPSISDLLKVIFRGTTSAGRSLFSSLLDRLSYLLLFLGIRSVINSMISVSLVGLRNMLCSFCGMMFKYSLTPFEGGGILRAKVSPMLEKCLHSSLVIVAGSYLGTPSLFMALINSPL